MYDDAKSFVRRCSQCQRHRNINTRDAMPLTSNLLIDIFDVWGIDFMGPFPNSEGCEYIFVAVDYVSKRVEALPCRVVDALHSKRMFHEVIFPRYRVPRIVISDGGSYFIDRTFQKALSKVGVDHRIATPSPSDEWSSRNVKQANQEYPSRDSESNGQKLEEQAQRSSVGIPNGLQNADRYDALSASLREDLSPSRRT
jgi:hypothetical protein